MLNNGSVQAEGSLETQETKLKDIVSYFLVSHDRAYILLTICLKINYTGKKWLISLGFPPMLSMGVPIFMADIFSH